MEIRFRPDQYVGFICGFYVGIMKAKNPEFDIGNLEVILLGAAPALNLAVTPFSMGGHRMIGGWMYKQLRRTTLPLESHLKLMDDERKLKKDYSPPQIVRKTVNNTVRSGAWTTAGFGAGYAIGSLI